MAFNPSAGAPTSWECQNCGAKLPPPTAEGTQICQYCQAVYHVQREASQPQGFTIVFGNQPMTFGNVPPVMGSFPGPSSEAIDAMLNAGVKTAKWSLFLGLFITVVVIAAVGIPLWLAFKDGLPGFTTSSGGLGGVSGSNGVNLDPTVGVSAILPGEPTAAPNVLVLSRYYDQSAKKSQTVLVRIDTAGKKIAWQSKPLDDANSNTKLVIDGANAYLDDKSKVRAIKLADGSDVWAAPLPDKLSTNCSRTTCLAVSGDRVFARTADGQLQAIDAASGKPAWSRKLKDTSARTVVVGDTVVVVDGEKGKYDISLVNGADGAEKGKIAPTCKGSGPSADDFRYDSPVIAVPFAPAVIVGTGVFEGCFARYELANPAAPVWNTPVAKLNFSSGIDTAFGEGQLLVSESSSQNGLAALDLTTGAWKQISADADYQLQPVGAIAGKAIVYAQNQRGTRKLAVWGIDLATGTKAWEKSFGEAEPMDGSNRGAGDILSSNEVKVTTGLADGKVRTLVITSDAQSSVTVTAEALDPASGVAAGSNPALTLGKVTGVNEAVPVGWFGTKCVVVVNEKVLVVESTDGKQVASVP